jgi:hypothetical protein
VLYATVPFVGVALAGLWLLPAVVVHALLNVATIAAFEGEMSALLRSMLAAVLLLSLVLGTVVAGRRLGIFRLVPVVERVPAEA